MDFKQFFNVDFSKIAKFKEDLQLNFLCDILNLHDFQNEIILNVPANSLENLPQKFLTHRKKETDSKKIENNPNR
jgi:hypothetical protein